MNVSEKKLNRKKKYISISLTLIFVITGSITVTIRV